MADREDLVKLANSGSIGTERVASGLANPLYVTAPPDDFDRLFILEKNTGQIKILNLLTGTVNETPFLDLEVSTVSEQGVLGLAFDPDYEENGVFYVNFTNTNGVSTIRRYEVSSDPDVADASSGDDISRIPQPAANHNGGWIGFGPDGYLYYATGDGGSGNDPWENGQDLTTPLSAVLRIDVRSGIDDFPADGNRNFAIPADNPFIGQTQDGEPILEEIWAYGLRNPWRTSFDRETGDLYIADVGQNAREEVNFQSADSDGGENYGWRLREGKIPTPTVGGGRPADNVDPVYDYTRGDGDFQGNSVTGGYVYRGPVNELQGKYVFGDFGTSRIWSFEVEGNGITDLTDWTAQFVPDQGDIRGISSFGEDAAGNLYIVDFFDGEVFRVVGPTGSAASSLDVSFSDFSNVSGLDLNGDAAQAGNVLRLTPESNSQAGSAFLDTAFVVNGGTSFRTEFTFKLHGAIPSSGADGIAFVLQSSPDGAGALGGRGGNLGYDQNQTNDDAKAITESLAIEFDTFQGTGDPDANHVGLLINGDVITHLEAASPTFDLNGGNAVTAWIDYDGSSDLLEVYVADTGIKPAAALISTTFDLTSVLGESVYAGFTGATGGLMNLHDIESWTLSAFQESFAVEYSNFSDVSGLDLNGDAAQAGDVLRLTAASNSQIGSAFLDETFVVDDNTSFQTAFTFRLYGGNGSSGADGIAFVLQSSPEGAGALGDAGGSLGYDDNQSSVDGTAITDSVAIEFDTFQGPGDPNGNHVGLLINGDVVTHLEAASPAFDLNDGDAITAWIEYDGASDLLEVYVSNTEIKPGAALISETFDLTSMLSDSAHAGFTGATGGLTNAQDIESWTFLASQVPVAPVFSVAFSDFSDVSDLDLNGDAAQAGDVLQLTSATNSQAGSAFLDTTFSVEDDTSFATEFAFRMFGGNGEGGADGIAFVLHSSSEGSGALGERGGSLGYDDNQPGVDGTAIGESLAIEFDTFQGPGDPNANHVGLLINGDAVTHLNAASPAFDLNGGDTITAWIDYDGATDLLEVYVSNTGTKPGAALSSETFDLTSVLGDGVYAGFTGATGGLANAQEIESWTFEAAGSDFFT